MDVLRLPAMVGTAASLFVAATILVPYVALDAGGSSIAAYYDYGPLTAVSVLVLGLVTAVVFASGSQGRADPATAAGTALGLGVVTTVVAALWAIAVPYEFVTGFTTAEWFEYHRWTVVGAAGTVAGCGVWYSYMLGLLSPE